MNNISPEHEAELDRRFADSVPAPTTQGEREGVPFYWHGDLASWQAWNDWLAANNLRNGGSQDAGVVWLAGWKAAQGTTDLLRKRCEETATVLEQYAEDADHTTLAANLRDALEPPHEC